MRSVLRHKDSGLASHRAVRGASQRIKFFRQSDCIESRGSGQEKTQA